MAEVIPIVIASDASLARRTAKRMTLAVGFDEKVSEEIALAVSELAFNLVRHAQGGQLTLAPINERGRTGIQIESLDSGPGIADVEQAMTDGFSMSGGLGCGLGAVNRLMDDFNITSQCTAPAGTHIVCKRWLNTEAGPLSPCPLEFGVATRACPKMAVNGDAFVIKRWSTNALVSVIDGLGHGQAAHRAAQAAKQYVETHFDQPLEAMFRGVERTCRTTRGVVIAAVRFDFDESSIRFYFAGLGNIEARLFGGTHQEHFIVRRGIVGVNAPKAWVTEHSWERGNLMVLHSDGLTHRWGAEDFPDLGRESATTSAQRLLHRLAKDHDDATVVVVRDTTL